MAEIGDSVLVMNSNWSQVLFNDRHGRKGEGELCIVSCGAAAHAYNYEIYMQREVEGGHCLKLSIVRSAIEAFCD